MMVAMGVINTLLHEDLASDCLLQDSYEPQR